MDDPASKLLPFGDLELVEIVFYYDFPRFYVLKTVSDPSVRILVQCTDEDENHSDWIYSAISIDEWALIKSERLPVRLGFTDCRAHLWKIHQVFENNKNQCTATEVDPTELLDSELPEKDATLYSLLPYEFKKCFPHYNSEKDIDNSQ